MHRFGQSSGSQLTLSFCPFARIRPQRALEQHRARLEQGRRGRTGRERRQVLDCLPVSGRSMLLAVGLRIVFGCSRLASTFSFLLKGEEWQIWHLFYVFTWWDEEAWGRCGTSIDLDNGRQVSMIPGSAVMSLLQSMADLPPPQPATKGRRHFQRPARLPSPQESIVGSPYTKALEDISRKDIVDQ